MCPDLPYKLEDTATLPAPGAQAGVLRNHRELRDYREGLKARAVLLLGRELGQSTCSGWVGTESSRSRKHHTAAASALCSLISHPVTGAYQPAGTKGKARPNP